MEHSWCVSAETGITSLGFHHKWQVDFSGQPVSALPFFCKICGEPYWSTKVLVRMSARFLSVRVGWVENVYQNDWTSIRRIWCQMLQICLVFSTWAMDDLNSYSMFEYVSSWKIILDEHSSLEVVLRISLWPMKPWWPIADPPKLITPIFLCWDEHGASVSNKGLTFFLFCVPLGLKPQTRSLCKNAA